MSRNTDTTVSLCVCVCFIFSCISTAGAKPVHPGQRTEGSVQYPGLHHRPRHDAGHQGGGGRHVPVCEEDGGPRHPEALQVTRGSDTHGVLGF